MNILDDWRAWMGAQGLAVRTIEERISTIKRLCNYTGEEPQSITAEGIIAYLSRPVSITAKASYHASIRAYCKWLIVTGQRTDDPTMKTPTPKRPKRRPRPITDQQLDQLLDAANRRRTRTYILLAALAGMRVHEIAKIRGQDIDGDQITITGKGGSTSTVPLHHRLIEEAKNYPRRGYWFPAYESQTAAEHVRSHAVSAAIHDAMLRAGFSGTPHQLRHWFATALVTQGVGLAVVQKLMRHESPATTVIYAEVPFVQQRDGLTRIAA